MKRLQAFKFRLEPKVQQRILLAQYAGCCRLVWNKALGLIKELLEAGGKPPSYADLCKYITSWKKEEATLFLSLVHSQPLQQMVKSLSQALKEAFDRSNPKKFPRFKKKGKRDSFRYPQGFKLDEPNSRIYLPKIGWVRYIKSQSIKGIPKNVTISKRGDHWYVSIQTEQEVEAPTTSATSMVGIDRGVTYFCAISNGEMVKPISSFKRYQKKLAKLQKQLARKIKGSSNFFKLKKKINKLHIKIADIRKDFLHKLTHDISKNHAVVVLEDLKIANMTKSAKGTVEEPGKNVKAKSGLNCSILDQGWYEFQRQLGYKLEWLGGILILVEPRNTSRKCPECEHTSKENRKTQASFACVKCGYSANADFVAACNIERAGHARLACGEIEPVRVLAQEPAQTAAFG